MTHKNGFTLIEILVALTILSTVLIMVSGLFSQFIMTQRRDIAELGLQEDLRSAMEFMSREIRTGYGSTFAIDGATLPIGSGLIFRNQNGQCVEYRIQSNQLQRAVANTPAVGQECDQGVNFGQYTAITGPQTAVTIRFLVPTDITTNGQLNRQGFVTIVVHAVAATNTTALPLDLETTVTSRQIQVYE